MLINRSTTTQIFDAGSGVVKQWSNRSPCYRSVGVLQCAHVLNGRCALMNTKLTIVTWINLHVLSEHPGRTVMWLVGCIVDNIATPLLIEQWTVQVNTITVQSMRFVIGPLGILERYNICWCARSGTLSDSNQLCPHCRRLSQTPKAGSTMRMRSLLRPKFRYATLDIGTSRNTTVVIMQL